ncbi:MAG: hypothetical protein FWD25_03710 [Clostridia bacterium]|nr:hypothetical protein [Clostridia bacterium]
MKNPILDILLALCFILGVCSSEIVDPSASRYPVFERIKIVHVYEMGGYYEEASTDNLLSDEQRSMLWSLMRVDGWVVASDLPETGFLAEFCVVELCDDEYVQIWFFNDWSKEHALIVPGVPPQKGEKICYFAPADVIIDIMAYVETLNYE